MLANNIQPGNIAAQPGNIAAQPGNIAAQPGNIAAQPGNIAAQPGNIAAQPGNIAAQPGNIAAQPGNSKARSGKNVTPSGKNVTPSENNVPQPGNNASQPGNEGPQPGVNNLEIDSTDVTLWTFGESMKFIALLAIITVMILSGFSGYSTVQNINNNFSAYRCNPLIMPFVGFLQNGTSPVDNFNFCLGDIFKSHSNSFMDSIASTFSEFATGFENTFHSLDVLRNSIASMGGGIATVFQDFTDRIFIFFFKLKVSALHIKTLFMRIYATLFAVMYMGTSGINGVVNFTNTFLFGFLDTFCFPGNTELVSGPFRQKTPIKNIKIGDVLYPGASRVTATFKFYARGQPMVKLGSTVVSTNHYVYYQGKPIKAGQHPFAIKMGSWDSDELLYCLNTSNNIIPVQYLSFVDYDETSAADTDTMQFIDQRLNGGSSEKEKARFREYGFGIEENTRIKMMNGVTKPAREIEIGDTLSNKSKVVGIIYREFNEICRLANGLIITPSTLYWADTKWRRFGETEHFTTTEKMILISFIVTPNSQIELENGLIVRDYMELCSPDAEMYYSQCLESSTSGHCNL
jgi:hypothetical protein